MSLSDVSWELWVSAASGVVLAAIGLLVWRVRPEDKVNRGFALYTVGFGLAATTSNLDDALYRTAGVVSSSVGAALEFASMFLALAAATGLAVFALRYPTPLSAEQRRWLKAPAIVIVVATIASATAFAITLEIVLNFYPRVWQFSQAGAWFAIDIMRFVSLGAGILLAIRFRHVTDDGTRTSIALVAAALMLYGPAFWGWIGLGTINSVLTWYAWTNLFFAFVGPLLLCTLWLWNTRLPRGAAVARNLAILAFVPAVVGMIVWVGPTTTSPSWIMRIAEILILAYAVVRHQVLGIDLKLRFAISKSTIAAIFIAVFFIASEAAQQFFGERFNSTYIGIGIAGTLVFAMAPLQKVAEKLAEKAVPISPAANPRASTAASRETAYVAALRVAMKDRRLTRAEEIDLHRLAEELGIGTGRAHELLVSAEGDRTVTRRRK